VTVTAFSCSSNWQAQPALNDIPAADFTWGKGGFGNLVKSAFSIFVNSHEDCKKKVQDLKSQYEAAVKAGKSSSNKYRNIVE